MSHQVKHGDAVHSHSRREEHIAKLAHGGIGDDTLDVILHHTHRTGEYSRDHTHRCNEVHGIRSQFVKDMAPRHQVHPRGDHCRRMDQCADRGRPLHRVGQPSVKRYLRRLGKSTHQKKQSDQ